MLKVISGNNPEAPRMDENKAKALQAALSQIEKQFGKGSIMKMGAQDVDRAIAEMKRVTAADGRILLIVEVGHDVTPTEPHRIDGSIVERFAPEFATVQTDLFATRDDHNLYGSIHDRLPYIEGEPGVLCAMFARPLPAVGERAA